MQLKQLQQIETGQDLVHNRYGLCTLISVKRSRGNFFGAIIQPKTEEGIALLAYDAQTHIKTFLECSLRRLKCLQS